MITTLHIKNIGIIDDLSINLNSKFNVLTGETGAGKTLTIDALNILAGGRFSKEIIRTGEEYSYVEMSLYIPSLGENNIIVSREISLNGRNLCKINGRLVTVNELKKFMKNIIDIHGQNDNQSLLDINNHIKYLDNFSGEKLGKIKNEYQELFNKYNEIRNKLKENYGDDKEKQRKLDLLKYQINEIEAANLKENEENELEEQRKIILNSEKIIENLNNTDIQISDNAIDLISEAIRSMEKIENLDDKYLKTVSDLKSTYYELQEISRDIKNLKLEVDFDDIQRNTIEERLDLISSLKRKYGNNVNEIIDYKKEIEKEIEEIENLEEYTEKLKNELEKVKKEMFVLSKKMNEIRKQSSNNLEQKINLELKDLEMKNAKFIVDLDYRENEEFNINGLNNIEFLITTNVGETPKTLIKIASGGEMSRIMLAIKTVLADVDEIPILIFDEIDTGISGIAANSVGEKLKQISKKHQVICVTHLAPIAAKGDYNYYISKQVKENKTKTDIKLLNEEEILKEIARISSGNVTEASINYAKELRNA